MSESSELLETLIEVLSLHAFIGIRNTFTWFEASPEARQWKVHVNHVTHRDFGFDLSGGNLCELLKQAMDKIEVFELEKVQERERWMTVQQKTRGRKL